MLSFLGGHQAFGKECAELLAKIFDLALERKLLIPTLDCEVVVVEGLDLRLNLIHALRNECHLFHLGKADQRISGDELRFKIWQRSDAVVFSLTTVNPLITDKRNEKTELADLDGDGLDVRSIQTVLDKVELPSIVVFVVGKVTFDGGDGGFTRGRIWNLRSGIDLELPSGHQDRCNDDTACNMPMGKRLI